MLADTSAPTEREWSDLFTSEPDTDDDVSDTGAGVSESGGEGEGPEAEELVSPAAAPSTAGTTPRTGGVARRTRAHLSLEHYELDQLEEFLQVSSAGTVRHPFGYGRASFPPRPHPRVPPLSWGPRATFSWTTAMKTGTRPSWQTSSTPACVYPTCLSPVQS